MDNREMLELAAKAAGYEASFSPLGCVAVHGLTRWLWNPLTDDGDALRLAVKLNLDIVFYDQSDTVRVRGTYSAICQEGVRLAITRAAAEIGKHMQ